MSDVLPPRLAATTTYSVLVADPEMSARSVLAAVIEAAPGLELAGEAATGEEAVARAAETHPDVVVLGTGAPGMNIVATTGRLLDAADPPRVIILTAPDHREQGRDALRAGASGLLLRDAPPEQLLGAIPAVAAGYVLMAPALVHRTTERYVRPESSSASDLHDVLGHTLAAINRESELVALLPGAQPGLPRAELATVLARRPLAEAHALATEIEGVRTDLESMGVRVEVTRALATLPWPIQKAFGRVAREAAGNIVRHSEAGHCLIEVWAGSRTAHLRITNNGAGHRYSTPGTGAGLAALTTKLRDIGGTLVHSAGPHLTYRVEATAPLSRSDWWRKMAIKVVLAKDEALTREALTELLQLSGDIEVVAHTGRGDGVLELVNEHQAELAVLDVHMPGMNGVEVAEQLNRERPGFPVVILTHDAKPGHLRRALQAGVRGVLTKETSVSELSRVIREVRSGGRHCPPELVAEMLAVGENPLTAREAEILKAAEDGSPITAIASQLHLSPGTVRNHIHSAIHKLKAGNRISAVHAAAKAGWI
ncbi:response regulator [Streptomyces sp. NBC_01506]|uniref:response regulator n=1 Tax=Streptomyces sp. NBC_01506 TaxID=2903887 RepID=UPI003862FA7C